MTGEKDNGDADFDSALDEWEKGFEQILHKDGTNDLRQGALSDTPQLHVSEDEAETRISKLPEGFFDAPSAQSAFSERYLKAQEPVLDEPFSEPPGPPNLSESEGTLLESFRAPRTPIDLDASEPGGSSSLNPSTAPEASFPLREIRDSPYPSLSEGLGFLDNFEEQETGKHSRLPPLEAETFGLQPMAAEQTTFSSIPPEDPSVPPEDRGAAVAERTVHKTKRRTEHFPLVGDGPEALRARHELLKALAKKIDRGFRVDALLAAAELSEELGELEPAQALYRICNEKDPAHLLSNRACRRVAEHSDAWSEVARLLQEESRLDLSKEDQCLLMMKLAEVQLAQLNTPVQAAVWAGRAIEAQRCAPAAMLRAETCFALEKPQEALQALVVLAQTTKDPKLAATVWVELARHAERGGQGRHAKATYERALEADPSSFDALLGIARCAKRLGDLSEAASALLQASELIKTRRLREALHRAAAKLYLASGDHQEALEAVRSCTNPLAYRTMAEAARRSKHEQLRIQALQSLCNDTISTERALAFLSLSEAYAEQNRLDEAQSALKEAASADRALSLIRVAQEMLVRRRGEHPHFGETKLETSTSAIVSAAKSAMEPNAHIEERSLLTQAAQQGSLTADTITLDAATEHRDIEAMVEALERVSAQGDLSQRAGPVLTKAGLLESLGRSSETIKLLRATETSQLSASLLRYSLARRVMDRDPKDAALIWQEESENQTGHSAAAAATMTGRLLHRLGEDARSMFRRATQASAQYRPAIWNLEDIFRKEGQLEEAARIQRDLAGSEKTSFACTRLVRAAIRLSESPEKARFALEEALTLSPLDPILRSLRSKHSLPDPLQDEADYLQQIASELSPDFSRSAKLRAALLFSNTGNLENAEKIYQELLSDSPEDPFALIALDRIELVNDKLTNAANRRMTAAKNAISVEEQITTLEELADFEQHERNDTSSAILARQALLEVSPGHIPSLRCVERYLMRMNRIEDLVSIEASLAEHLTDATDAAAHARLAIRMMTRDQTKAIPVRRIDPLIFRVREALHELPWVARMWLTVEGNTILRKSAEPDKKIELIAEARHALEDSFASPLEKATAKIRTAEALLAAGKSDEAVLKVLEAARQQPDHLFVHEYSARILLASGAFEEATNHFEKASELSKSDRRRTELLYEVARVHADHLNDPTSSLAALERVVRADVTYRDTFERTKAIFLSRGDSDGLLELISQRIRAGGPAEELIALDLDHAGISAKIGALKSAKQSLKHALSLKPNHKEVLQRLSEVCCADEDWRGAAEALIKMARQASDRTELKQLFFRLGEIYDTHLPEPKRAEAAYLRVLKTAPSDLDTLDRLATLYRREGEFQKACEMLTDLTQIVSDPERNRDYRIAFAECLEELGDLKRAEATLEQTRRSAPLDLHILKTITQFYERHDDASALGMHLSRSLKEFQRAVDTNAVERGSWEGLVEIHRWRGRLDAARCCASACVALGIEHEHHRELLGVSGDIPGAAERGADPALDELLAPSAWSPAARFVFKTAQDAFDKLLSLDLRVLKPQKAAKEAPIRLHAAKVARWFDVSEIQVLTTDLAPTACIPIRDSPITVLFGEELLASLTPQEQTFLLVRAAKVAASKLSVALRTQQEEFALVVYGLQRLVDPSIKPKGNPLPKLDDFSRKLHRSLGRKRREELQPMVLEMVGHPQFSSENLAVAASQLGNRAALLSIGSVPVALSSLLKLAGQPLDGDFQSRAQAIRSVPEAWSLLRFATSKTLCSVREQTETDKRTL